MKIKAKTNFVSGRFEAVPGQVLEIDSAHGTALVSAGFAVVVSGKTAGAEAEEPRKK